MKNRIKLIILLIVSLCIFFFGNNTSNAYLSGDDVSVGIGAATENMGSLYVYNGSYLHDFNSNAYNNVFCVSQGTTLREDGGAWHRNLRIYAHARIEGTKATVSHLYSSGTFLDASSNNNNEATKLANLRMASIIGEQHDFTNDHHLSFEGSGLKYGDKQRAIYGYIAEWVNTQDLLKTHLNNLGINPSGGICTGEDPYGVKSKITGSGTTEDSSMSREFEEKNIVSEIYPKEQGQKDYYVKVGPFKWNYSGNFNITVKDQDNNTINPTYGKYNGSNFETSNKYNEIISSGSQFYILVKADGKVTSLNSVKVETTSNGKIKTADLWFLGNSGDAYQQIMICNPGEKIVDSHKEDTISNIPIVANLKIIKENEQDNKIKINGVGFKIKHNQLGYISEENGRIVYEKTDKEAKVYYTRNINGLDGVIEINNLLVGTYTAYEVENSHGGYVVKEQNNIVVKAGGNNIKKIENNQKYIKISGYVWEDKISGKNSKKNNKYQDDVTDDGDVRIKDKSITVSIKDKERRELATLYNTKTGEPLSLENSTKKTDSNGNYSFDGCLTSELENYYIEFEYDGLIYQNVDPQSPINPSRYINEEKGRIIQNGVYEIQVGKDTTLDLDVNGISQENGANIQLCKQNGGANQKFVIEYVGDGYYTITAMHSGKSVDVANGSSALGTNVQQYEKNGSDAQKWKIVKIGENRYSFISKCNNLYMDIKDANITNGQNIQVYTGNGSDAQKFQLNPLEEYTTWQTVPNGDFEIKTSLNTNYELEVENASTWNGASIKTTEDQNKESQKFTVKYISDGLYNIVSKSSGKFLEANGTNVTQNAERNSDAQKWTIEYSGENDYYRIKSKSTGKYIDIKDFKYENGIVQLHDKNGTDAQKFRFDKLGGNTSKAIEIERKGTEAIYSYKRQSRESFNESFNSVEGSGHQTNTITQSFGKTHRGSANGGQELSYNIREDYKAYLENTPGDGKYNITANTEIAGLDLSRYFKYGYVEEIKDINLGLKEREQPDLATVQKEAENVKLSLNGYDHTYKYSTDKTTDEYKQEYMKEFDYGVKFGKKRGEQSFTRYIYESDISYNPENKSDQLQAYVTYKVQIINEATTLTTRCEELIDYFDNKYSSEKGDIKAGLALDENGNISSEEKYKVNISEAQKVNDEYSKVTITVDNDSLLISPINKPEGQTEEEALNSAREKINSGNSVDVYIQFKVKSDVIKSLLIENDKEVLFDNIAEIGRYTTYKDGKLYAGIDKDSAPNNAKPSTDNNDSKRYEDDTSISPAFKMKTPPEDPPPGGGEPGREMTGTVFEDNEKLSAEIKTNEIREGNGIYNVGAEHGIGEVDIELKEQGKSDDKAMKYVTKTVTETGKYGIKFTTEPTLPSSSKEIPAGTKVILTPEKYVEANKSQYKYIVENLNVGDYFIKGYIPGKYKLTYTWGGQTYTTNAGEKTTYTVQDYKGTIYKDEEHKEEYWYKDNVYKGDVNYDKKLTKEDAVEILRYVVKEIIPTEDQKLRADVDNDGNVSVLDASMLLSILKGDRDNPNDNKLRYSDAIDNYDTRNAIDNEISEKEKNAETKIYANTKMDSTTSDMEFNFEYSDNKPKDSKLDNYVTVYKVKDIDFGIVERPRQAIEVEKRVSHIKLTLPNGMIITDAEVDKNGKFKGQVNGLVYSPSDNIHEYGSIKIELDNELVQGSTLEITYLLRVDNISEKDYKTEDFYKYGSVREPNNTEQIIKITPKGIYDYLDSEMSTNDGKWEIITQEEYNGSEVNYITKTEYKTSERTVTTKEDGTIETKYKWDAGGTEKTGSHSEYLTYLKEKRKVSLVDKKILKDMSEELQTPIEPGRHNETRLLASKVLSVSDEIELENNMEVTKVEQNSGRPISESESIWKDTGEIVTQIPPTGENKNIIIYTIIVITSLIIIVAGIIIIKKKVL